MKYFDPVNYGRQSAHNVTIYGSVLTLSGTSGTANITINGIVNTTICTFVSTNTAAASTWVTNNYAYYYAKGYIVSAAAGVITVNPRHSWDSVNRMNMSIANVSGNHTGTLTGRCEIDLAKGRKWRVTFGQNITILAPKNVKDGDRVRLELKATGAYSVTWTAAAWYFAGGTEPTQTSTSTDIVEGEFQKAFAARYCSVTLAGTTGTCSITMGGVTVTATFNGSLNTTATDFVTLGAADFLEEGITVTATGGTTNPLLFTISDSDADYDANPVIVPLTGDLTATVINYPAGRVLCDQVSQDIKQ